MSSASRAERRGRPTPAEETARVEGLTHEGEGVVHGGKTVFVAGALPGELIRLRRTRRHRQHDAGELLEVLEASPERVTPRCPHFGVCGGCATYGAERSRKPTTTVCLARTNLAPSRARRR